MPRGIFPAPAMRIWIGICRVAKTPDQGRHPLPDVAELQKLLSGFGIGPETRVVVYDEGGGALAARLWWLLRWLGHAQVSLLDGGFAAWCAAGLPVSAERPPVRNGPLVARPGSMPVLTTDEIEASLGSDQTAAAGPART